MRKWIVTFVIMQMVVSGCGSAERVDTSSTPVETPHECRSAMEDLRRCLTATSRDTERVDRREDALRERLSANPPRTREEQESMRKQCVSMSRDLKTQCL
jgi:hypothetical protein